MLSKRIVVDANILARGVLGRKVRHLIENYSSSTVFFVPDKASAEAQEHLGRLMTERGGDPEFALITLRALLALCEIVDADIYAPFESEARRRLGLRDPEDWPILACALAVRCPIWTEDTDFFGCGVATWTSERIEIFLTDVNS